jgi:PilZ domain-containing protein
MSTPILTAPALPVAGQRKTIARVALFNLPESPLALLTECFRQFGVETVQVRHEHADRLQKEKFEACVLPLDPAAGPVIEMARASASNSRMVIYGLGGTAQDALRYSKLCLNAVFHEPLERSAAIKLVRSSRNLIAHEFQRYVRIPVMTEVRVTLADGSRVTATSQEISAGGMSLKSAHPPELGSAVEVSFSLLTLPRVWLRGIVAWRKTNKSFGIRFDPTDDRRQRLKDWLVAYLEA